MEKVWLSSTYFLDPKMAGASASTERMFTRLLAYCGNAETMGFVPQNAHKLVAIPNGNRSILDLISRKVLVEVEGGGYRFPAWSDWQESGDKLVERRRKDRERKAEKRAEHREMSADTSAESPPHRRGEERREENSKEFSSSSHVSIAGVREELPRGPAVPIDAWTIVRRVIPAEHSSATKTSLALEVSALLKQGTTETDVTAALEIWLGKPGLGPKVLPHLLSDVIRDRTAPPTSRGAPSKAESWMHLAHSLDSESKAIEQ
ncbi:hypothetical protein ACU5JM_09570 [Rhodococcus erythropolis]|uniref:hypothetical protein n=1 Tax=Rhodococcus erythropolis TaxID=1833 RepID=UPI00406BC4A0